MTPPPLDEGYLERFSEAVVQEIWNEMGRQRISSVRELARRAELNQQYVNSRLRKDPKTQKPVTMNVKDLATFGDALGVEPGELIHRANVALAAGDVDQTPRMLDGTPVDFSSREAVELWLDEPGDGDELAARRAQVSARVDETAADPVEATKIKAARKTTRRGTTGRRRDEDDA